MKEEQRYWADVLILDTYVKLTAKYGGLTEQSVWTPCQPNAICTCCLVSQQRKMTPPFSEPIRQT